MAEGIGACKVTPHGHAGVKRFRCSGQRDYSRARLRASIGNRIARCVGWVATQARVISAIGSLLRTAKHGDQYSLVLITQSSYRQLKRADGSRDIAPELLMRRRLVCRAGLAASSR